MVEPTASLPVTLQHTSQSHNSAVDRAFKLPCIYNFDSDDEDDDVYAEEAFEAVLPASSNFDALSREEAAK